LSRQLVRVITSGGVAKTRDEQAGRCCPISVGGAALSCPLWQTLIPRMPPPLGDRVPRMRVFSLSFPRRNPDRPGIHRELEPGQKTHAEQTVDTFAVRALSIGRRSGIARAWLAGRPSGKGSEAVERAGSAGGKATGADCWDFGWHRLSCSEIPFSYINSLEEIIRVLPRAPRMAGCYPGK
jgi:hypothetical protein